MPSGGELKIIAFEEGSDIVMRFEDDGVGIPQQNLPNIFMPFFSRRADIKHGTGLGLPISRAIMQGINGTLSVESEEGKGSCFIIRMPKASKEVLS
jgi:signal transduction histidine kinase